MPNNSDLNLQLTVTDAQPQSVIATYFVRNLYIGGGPCNPCPIVETENLKVDKKPPLNLYPIPAKDILNYTIEGAQYGEISVQVFNQSGIEVMSKKLLEISNTNSGTIDVKNYKPGIYYLMVVGKDFVTTKKFVKIQ
jgi:hypothetical protein